MIEALKGEDIIKKAGGRFKLCAMVQHRVRELMEGARPLVDRKGRTDIEIAIEEALTGKISLELPKDSDADKH